MHIRTTFSQQDVANAALIREATNKLNKHLSIFLSVFMIDYKNDEIILGDKCIKLDIHNMQVRHEKLTTYKGIVSGEKSRRDDPLLTVDVIYGQEAIRTAPKSRRDDTLRVSQGTSLQDLAEYLHYSFSDG